MLNCHENMFMLSEGGRGTYRKYFKIVSTLNHCSIYISMYPQFSRKLLIVHILNKEIFITEFCNIICVKCPRVQQIKMGWPPLCQIVGSPSNYLYSTNKLQCRFYFLLIACNIFLGNNTSIICSPLAVSSLTINFNLIG